MVPKWLLVVRHDTSVANEICTEKLRDPLFEKFVRSWEKNFQSRVTKKLAKRLLEKYKMKYGEADIPLADGAGSLALWTGRNLAEETAEAPDVIITSPYLRALQTLEFLIEGWPALKKAQIKEDERIRERDGGILSEFLFDWRIYQTMHPEQKALLDKNGDFYFRPPQGENLPDVKERIRSFLRDINEEYGCKKVLIVSHQRAIQCLHAIICNLDPAASTQLENSSPSSNCAVTLFAGCNGKLVTQLVNEKMY